MSGDLTNLNNQKKSFTNDVMFMWADWLGIHHESKFGTFKELEEISMVRE